ncbi:hypothetical protein [Sporolactobacillus vineae]|uniref:hypothetical protein n=1 Tax=Sporolactobacillus vineae TaxID=444463 RepID=UPI000287A3B0|nr:hypothetical protein [Sporolactobacillus vineae]
MQLTIMPAGPVDQCSHLTEESKNELLNTIEYMEKEIDHLKQSTSALDEAHKIVLTEQLKGIEMALDLTGYTLIYQ